MKKIVFSISLLVGNFIFSQTGNVGINNPTPESTLDVVAINPTLDTETKIDGVLVPRVSKARAEAMGNTVPNSNLIFVNDLAAPTTIATTTRVTATGFYYYDSTQSLWIPINFSDNDWHTTGNTGTTVGTNFLGTTDAKALMFKTNNVQSGYIDYLNPPGNTAFGNSALLNGPSANIAAGNTNNNANTAVGFNALKSLGTVTGTWQTSNVAVGNNAMGSLVGGAWNTAVGTNAMGSATGDPTTLSSMRNNVALGISALANLDKGSFNIAIGPNAMSQAKTVVASDVITNNTAFGLTALDVLNNGANNIAFGFYAGNVFKSGSNNVFIGTQPGINQTSGNSNIFIGWNATGTTTTSSNEINIGNVITGTGSTNGTTPSTTKKIGINVDAKTNPNSTLQVGGSVAAKIRALGSGTVASDDYTILVQGNISMPTADATNTGRIYNLIKDTSSSVTISGTFRSNGANSTDVTLNGGATSGLNVQSNGTAWVIISRY